MNWYQAVVDLVSKLWAGFVRGLTEVFKWCSEFYQLYNWGIGVFLGLLLFAVTYVWDIVSWLGSNIPALLTALESGAGIVGEQVPGPLGQGFAVANAILPLTEAFGFLVVIGPIWMIAVTIRVIKAWIPTVA